MTLLRNANIQMGISFVTVIVVGKGISDPSSNPERGYRHFTLH